MLEPLLAPDGVLAFAAEVVIAGDSASDRLPGRFVAEGGVEGMIARHAGLKPLGPSDWRISEATLDCLAVAGGSSEREPHFVVQIGRVFSATAVWVLQKQASTQSSAWKGLDDDWRAHAR
jgi:hypothetical protein